MDAATEMTPRAERAGGRPRLRAGCFVLESLTGLATAYYGYYIFDFMEKRFGFSRADNLLLAAVYGFTYMISAACAGQLAQRLGRFRLLRLGFLGMLLSLLAGAAAPVLLGPFRPAMWLEFAVLIVWTVSASTGWPTLQGLLSSEGAGELPKIVGIYNLIWAGTSGVAFVTAGIMFDRLPTGTTFLLPAAIHAVELLILYRLEKRAGGESGIEARAEAAPPPVRAANDRARAFVRLAWIANPFAYVAMYGFVPVLPQLAARLGLSTALAGVTFCVWFLSRFVAFFWFWRWPGWHYQFRWLLTAFVGMIGCFFVILLCPVVWAVIVAEIVFGLAIGLIYYSSLFYSMDVGASGGKQGGIHEAAIGFGIGAGPLVGFAALRLFPSHTDAGTWNIGGALILGLLLFLVTRRRWRRAGN
jgi:predicted MFS family arabinose efflux permease